MTSPNRQEPDPLAFSPPLPHDLKVAIEFMRAAVCRSISMADLAEHCGVASRTLNEHFRTFLDVSPMRYFRQLRLSAARESLLSGKPGISVTEVANRFEFNHFGRFAEQYRSRFGEPPSAALRRGRVASRSEPAVRRSSTATASEEGDRQIRLPLSSRERPSIAILPCQIPANKPSLNEVAESLAEAIAAALCSVRALAVMVPRSTLAASRDPHRLARELDARYVLTCRVMQVDDRLRVIFRMVELATGYHIWGDSFDGGRDQLLELQDSAVEGVVRIIASRIRGAEIDRALRVPPQNLDAYGLVMRSLHLVFASRPESARRALDLLHRAIEIDPDYGLAPALAGWCYGQLVLFNGSQAPAEDKSRAINLVQRAAVLDDDDPLVLVTRCAVHTILRDFDFAEEMVIRALALDPSCGWAWGRSGWLHAYRGDSETAIEHFGRALSLNPNTSSTANCFVGIGSAYFNAGRYDAAVSWLRRAMRKQPNTWWVNRSLSVSYALLGDRRQALESLDDLRRSCPDLTVDQVMAAVPFRPHFLNRLGEGLSDLGLPS
jgi:adenylate cyclase